jgi:hypothetical protein
MRVLLWLLYALIIAGVMAFTWFALNAFTGQSTPS